jgi:hypothetical protein
MIGILIDLIVPGDVGAEVNSTSNHRGASALGRKFEDADMSWMKLAKRLV